MNFSHLIKDKIAVAKYNLRDKYYYRAELYLDAHIHRACLGK